MISCGFEEERDHSESGIKQTSENEEREKE